MITVVLLIRLGGDQRAIYHIPVNFVGSVAGLCGEDKEPTEDYWIIDEQYFQDSTNIHTSAEDSGKVFKRILFGIRVVVKEWRRVDSKESDKGEWPPKYIYHF